MSGELNKPLPRRDALKPVTGTPFYMMGEVAQDLCRLTGLSLDDDGKFLDVSRLPWWDYFRVLWAWVGGNYYAKCTPFPEPRCEGCDKGWEKTSTEHGFPVHIDGDYGGFAGCFREG